MWNICRAHVDTTLYTKSKEVFHEAFLIMYIRHSKRIYDSVSVIWHLKLMYSRHSQIISSPATLVRSRISMSTTCQATSRTFNKHTNQVGYRKKGTRDSLKWYNSWCIKRKTEMAIRGYRVEFFNIPISRRVKKKSTPQSGSGARPSFLSHLLFFSSQVRSLISYYYWNGYLFQYIFLSHVQPETVEYLICCTV